MERAGHGEVIALGQDCRVLVLTLAASLGTGTEDSLCGSNSGPRGPQPFDPVPEIIVFLGRCGFLGLHLATSYTLSQS